MRKKLVTLVLFSTITHISFAQSQPGNVQIQLFYNGTHGSNAKSGAILEIALKNSIGKYRMNPKAEDFILYLKAPKEYFSLADSLIIVQNNDAVFISKGTMRCNKPVDLDQSFICFPLTLSSPFGLNLSSITDTNWTYAFTIAFRSSKPARVYESIEIIDSSNNSELRNIVDGKPVFTKLLMGGDNQLKIPFCNKGGKMDMKNGRVVNSELTRKSTHLEIDRIYPNPAKTEVCMIVTSKQKGNVMVSITDVNGEVLMRVATNVDVGSNLINVDVGKLASGNYFVSLFCDVGRETVVGKFLKQ